MSEPTPLPMNEEHLADVFKAIGQHFDASGIENEITGGLHFMHAKKSVTTPYVVYRHTGTMPRGRAKRDGDGNGTEYNRTIITYSVYGDDSVVAHEMACKLAAIMKYAPLGITGANLEKVDSSGFMTFDEDDELTRVDFTHRIDWNQSINTRPVTED